jgi:hypothetical protein
MPIDSEDPTDIENYRLYELHLMKAWQAALALHRCVECARIDFIQSVELIARREGWDIVGPQPEDENQPVPVVSPDGIARQCRKCQTEPPEGAVRFFKRGTGELN